MGILSAMISAAGLGALLVQVWNQFCHTILLTRFLPPFIPLHPFASFATAGFLNAFWLWDFDCRKCLTSAGEVSAALGPLDSHCMRTVACPGCRPHRAPGAWAHHLHLPTLGGREGPAARPNAKDVDIPIQHRFQPSTS